MITTPGLSLLLFVILLELILLIILKKRKYSCKKTIIVLLMPIIIFIILLQVLLYAILPKYKSDITHKIEKANYCNAADDCVLITDFNCGSYVNKRELEKIESALNFYSTISIGFDCVCSSWGKAGIMSETKPKCENNKCMIESVIK